MVDPVTTTAAAITAADTISKWFNILRTSRDSTLIDDATAKLQETIMQQRDQLMVYSSQLIELQTKLIAQNDEITQLKEDVRKRVNYRLIDIGKGIMAYILHDPTADIIEGIDGEIPRYLCQRCHDVDGKDVVLQPYRFMSKDPSGFVCRACKETFITGHIPSSPDSYAKDYDPLSQWRDTKS